MRRWLFRLVRDALIVYVALVAIVALGQRRYIYYPQRAGRAVLESEARKLGLSVWDAREGEDYSGWMAPCGTAGVDVVVFHGNAGFALHRTYFVDCLQGLPFEGIRTVYLFEYPGYGARPGAPSEKVIKEKADQALSRLLEAETARRVILLGESLGGGVACWLAVRYPERVVGVFLSTPFSSLAEVAQVHYPYLPVRWLLRERYDNVEALKSYQGPVFVLAAEHDAVVPARLARKLYESYAGPKRLWVEPEADHNTLIYVPNAEWWVEAWRFLIDGY